jgi:transposase
LLTSTAPAARVVEHIMLHPNKLAVVELTLQGLQRQRLCHIVKHVASYQEVGRWHTMQNQSSARLNLATLTQMCPQ